MFFPGEDLFSQSDDAPGDDGAGESGDTVQEAQSGERPRGARGAPLTLQVETSSLSPRTGDIWTMTVLADYPDPQELTITPPPLPPQLTLDQISTMPKILEDETEDGPEDKDASLQEGPSREEARRWTLAELSFTIKSSGTAEILPIEFSVPGKRGFTGVVTLEIGGAADRRQTPSFRWEHVPKGLVQGERAELTGRLLNGAGPLPPGFLRGKAPVNAILEEQGEAGENLYRFTLIPLAAGNLVLGPWTIAYGGETLTVPRLVIGVKASPREAEARPPPGAGEQPGESAPAAAPEDTLPPALPEKPEKVFFLFRGDYERQVSKAKALLGEGRVPEALACLRRAERDSPAGKAIAPLRRAVEQYYGIRTGEDEAWRPWRALKPAFSVLSFLCLAPILGLIIKFFLKSKKRKVTFDLLMCSHYKTVIVFCLAGAVLCAVLALPAKESQGVMKETPVYRAPDPEGSVSTRFADGQPVTIYSQTGDWAYTETPEGLSGWVPVERVIPY